MSIIAEAVRHMLAAGMTHESVVAAIEAMESKLQPTRSKAAIRQERYRNKTSQNVTCDVTPLNGSNGFPHPSLNSLNPTKENTPIGVQKKSPPVENFPDEFMKLWEVFPRARRGNKGKAYAAWVRACSRVTRPDEIYDGCMAYCGSEEARSFPKGCEAWLNDDRWTVDYSTKDPPQNGFRSFAQQERDKTDLAIEEARKRYAKPN